MVGKEELVFDRVGFKNEYISTRARTGISLVFNL